MFLSGLYIHPRPTMFYEPRSGAASPSGSTSVMPPYSPVTREQAIQEAFDAEYHSKRRDYSCVVDKEGSFTVKCPKDTYGTENVLEALRLKQRMKARQALKTMYTENGLPSREPPELIPSYPSSCASSPANSPPPTPRLLPVDQPFPRKSPNLITSKTEASKGHHNRQPGVEKEYTRVAASRGSTPKKSQRPSQSRSSLLQRSLSRHSSRGSMITSSPPATRSSSTIMEIMRRLPPLPRFNPYMRTRAESTSSTAAAGRHELGGTLCGLLPRRRCKSEPSRSCARQI
ncbi:hypothetical protein C2E23DRAFT_160830 [Lenzites betulinus]|nr:hypothetical protein C2E23DRAFT_160830 [Lenzites betulinus]